MGNCCMRDSSSSMVWAGDDWGSMGRSGPGPENDKEGLLCGGVGAELRIRITRKQLDELLVTGGKKKKVLEKLIEKSVKVEVRRRRAWRPKLQTIPEFD